jgi:acetyl-CoA synthetase (ADP-forming)
LSEAESKQLLAPFGIPIAREAIVATAQEAAAAADQMGYPVVVKLNGSAIAHKTERSLVQLGVRSAVEVATVGADLLSRATAADGAVSLLVAEQVAGARELIAGLVDDPVFGAAVMIGVGGVLAEAIADVVFRLVPVTRADASEMLDDLEHQSLLDPQRGEPAVDRRALVDLIIGLSDVSRSRPDVASVDLNPLIVSGRDGRPIAVDALVELR